MNEDKLEREFQSAVGQFKKDVSNLKTKMIVRYLQKQRESIEVDKKAEIGRSDTE